MKYFSVITLISHLSSLQHRKIFLVAQSNSSTHPSWSLFMYVHIPPTDSHSVSHAIGTQSYWCHSVWGQKIFLCCQPPATTNSSPPSLPPSTPSLPSMLCVTTKVFSFIPSMVHSASDVCEARLVMSRWSQMISDDLIVGLVGVSAMARQTDR